ncbi:protein FAM217B isoform X2 [Hyaena hyaena]|nr:protein FAM217B isoform X2 [Hyaena hyaena]
MNAGSAWTKAQRSKPSSGKRQSKPQAPAVPSQLPGDARRESASPEGRPKRSPLDPRCRGASGSELFLDLQRVKVMKADEDEDSASDLSDSERVAEPPPPALAPPELRLRAEETDAADPGLDPDPGADPRGAQPTYRYADFLPAPFSSWDLRDLAVPPGAEPRPAAQGGAAGPLARYVARLLQLEWLQMQTVRSEKGKGARARPLTAPGAAGAPKSPGGSSGAAGAPARPHQEGPPKPGASRRRELQREEARPSYYAFDTRPKALHVGRSRGPSSQKPALEDRTEEQKKKWSKSPRLQRRDPPRGDSRPSAGVCGGGGGTSTQGATVRDSCGAPIPPAPGSLKKKGSGTCSQATTTSEKKLKTNGVKPSTCRFK